ncbi:sulfate ABC transporter substrate-binding protein [Devosia sp. 63-57]|uniref:sulfate ABC transporter substrate-binding protein n=1 Tax=Devosia sp. 63-57 TaxID=1895751 RepID=UPI000869F657|nr:sulfate ABC transporter substrate-binding protein [Devosia sp. 63-57]ODT49096.1 MAG: thiosulfate transporter subunit [Pelagibacterium sp. SCN 63-126]ODU83541.1 MAG: thiosulfate transporter subunit [Pelagibacterium sp. SCN 63-17]OJX43386.1 MAG: thiosulfate transporter subunit [Devosia sp. 63-57]
MNKFVASLAAALVLSATPVLAQPTDILNASYDIARELFEAENAAFVPAYAAQSGTEVTVNQSHAGTSTQARAILEGLPADVVTFNQVTDIDKLVEGGFVSADWQTEFANNASPFYSFPSFLVRAGNPKNITDWADLARDDVKVIFPNPKTSGNARYTYLAARAWANEAFGGDQAKVEEYLTKVFLNVPVFETGGRGATTAFTERELGDVLITFEAETLSAVDLLGADKYQAVTPSVSLLAEFPVAIVDKVVDARGSRDLAKAYLDFLYSTDGQRIAAERNHRVNDEAVATEFADRFPAVRLVNIDEAFGGWAKVAEEHFADGGLLDTVFVNQ